MIAKCRMLEMGAALRFLLAAYEKAVAAGQPPEVIGACMEAIEGMSYAYRISLDDAMKKGDAPEAGTSNAPETWAMVNNHGNYTADGARAQEEKIA